MAAFLTSQHRIMLNPPPLQIKLHYTVFPLIEAPLSNLNPSEIQIFIIQLKFCLEKVLLLDSKSAEI